MVNIRIYMYLFHIYAHVRIHVPAGIRRIRQEGSSISIEGYKYIYSHIGAYIPKQTLNVSLAISVHLAEAIRI